MFLIDHQVAGEFIVIPGVQVFPEADLLPANLLRFHLRFEQVLDEFNVNEDLRLIEFDGTTERVVENPFLDLNEGLWSANGLTLTVLLHPGRIKSGLASHKFLGPALREEYRYELQARGNQEANRVVGKLGEWFPLKRFVTCNPINERIDLDNVTLCATHYVDRSMLSIQVGRVCDRLATENSLALVYNDKSVVDFDVFTDGTDTSIALSLPDGLQPGRYTIHFASDFEDACGNRFSEAFEGYSCTRRSDESTRLSFSLTSQDLALPPGTAKRLSMLRDNVDEPAELTA